LVWLLLKLRWARWLLKFSKWWLTVHSPPWLVVGLWGCLSSPVGNWVNHLVDSNPNVWSHFLVSDIFSVLVNMLLVKGRWESNLGSIWDERLLGSVPVDSVNHGVGESVNFGIDTVNLLSSDSLGAEGLTDVSVVSSVLVKGRWESNLGSVWDERLLGSVPVDSINHGVGKTVDFSIDTIDLLSGDGLGTEGFANVSVVSSVLVEGRWESNLRSVWDEWLLGSVPVNSVNHRVGESVDFSINTVNLLSGNSLGAEGFTDVSVVSSMLIKRSWESNLGSVRDEGLLRSWPVKSINVLVSEVMNISINSVDTLWSFSSLLGL